MLFLDPLNALRGTYKAHKADIVAAALLEHGDCVAGAAAGCEHGISHNHKALLDIFRELAVIDHGLVCFLITVKADMTNLCHGDQRADTVHHSKAGAEDGHNGQLATGYDLCGGLADGGFYLHVHKGKVTGNLITHKEGNFLKKFTEIL